MKILMTTDTVGGVWTFAMELSAALEGLGVEVVLAAMGREPTEAQRRQAGAIESLALHAHPYRLEWMEDPWQDLERARAWLEDIAEAEEPDVIHFNNYGQLDGEWEQPTLLTLHSCVMTWWRAVKGEAAPQEWGRYRHRVCRAVEMADAVVAPTQAMLAAALAEYGHRETTSVISNGRAGFSPGRKHPYVLSAGRMWDEAKNLRALNEAAAGLPWRVYVAGETDRDGGAPASAEHLLPLGHLDHQRMRRWLGEADIYAFPARYEPFGLSVLEAAQCGCALVLGDLPSLRENWDGAAVFVPPDEPARLHEALRYLIRHPGLRRQLAGAAREKAATFTPDRMVLQYMAVYESLCAPDARVLQAESEPLEMVPRITAMEVRPSLRLVQDESPVVNPRNAAPEEAPGRVVMFCHSLRSDWNHGNAHFLRGIVAELQARGARVDVYEPRGGWSLENLCRERSGDPAAALQASYPGLRSTLYDLETFDLEAAVEDADLVIAHEWNDPALIRRLSRLRAAGAGFRLLFHDTHHRAATDPQAMARFDLEGFDGVLAFGEVIRRIYMERGWCARAWTWHEAADVRTYRPYAGQARAGDLVWVGNWGDDERAAELQEFLIDPVRELGLAARIFGVRYPDEAIGLLEEAGIDYGGYLPAAQVPRAFSRYGVTVHVPRRPYVEHLPGIPTIRVFEALACGIPLICSPWDDAEDLFTPGEDFLMVRSGREMKQRLRDVLHDRELARRLAARGRRTILARHTCAHRVDELMRICTEIGVTIRRQRRAALTGGTR